MNPHDMFARCEPLIQSWLQELPKFITRPESMMYLPTYGECVTAMAKNGWDDFSFIHLLNEMTDGKFSQSPDIFFEHDFSRKLHDAISTMIKPIESIGQTSDGVSAFWPIKLKMFPSQFALNESTLHGMDVGDRYRRNLAIAAMTTIVSGTHSASVEFVEHIVRQERTTGLLEKLLDATDNDKNTMLHLALRDITHASPEVAARKAKIANLMISEGADVFRPNRIGECPIDYVTSDSAKKYGLPSRELQKPIQRGKNWDI